MNMNIEQDHGTIDPGSKIEEGDISWRDNYSEVIYV